MERKSQAGKIFSKLYEVMNENKMKLVDTAELIFKLIQEEGDNCWFPDLEGSVEKFYENLKPKSLATKVN